MLSSSVCIYDISKLQLVSKELAENYVIDSTNIVDMCQRNRAVAENYGRSDLVQCWALAEMIAISSIDCDLDDGCGQNPFAKSLLESL